MLYQSASLSDEGAVTYPVTMMFLGTEAPAGASASPAWAAMELALGKEGVHAVAIRQAMDSVAPEPRARKTRRSYNS